MPAEAARFVLTLSCGDRRGIVAAVANCIASQDCNIVESAQYGDPESERFFMRVSFSAPGAGDGRELFAAASCRSRPATTSTGSSTISRSSRG